MIIHFEGVDGSGKSTQLKRVKEYLESIGKLVVSLRQPGVNDLGEKIREILLSGQYVMNENTRRFLYAADHAELVQFYEAYRGMSSVPPSWKLELTHPLSEYNVLIDRYSPLSNIIFGHCGDLLPLNEVKSVSKISSRSIYPDLIIVYTVSEETMTERLEGRDGNNFYDLKGKDFRDRVREGYENSHMYLTGERLVYIDGNGSEDEVFIKTIKEINEYII